MRWQEVFVSATIVYSMISRMRVVHCFVGHNGNMMKGFSRKRLSCWIKSHDSMKASSSFSPNHHHRYSYSLEPIIASSLSQRSFSLLFMATNDDDDDDENGENDGEEGKKSIESEWNISGLKKEIVRCTLRCHKKIGKASSRVKTAKAQVEELLTNPQTTMEQLEQCPNVDALEYDLQTLQQRLKQLTQLEHSLNDIKGTNIILPPPIAQLAITLDLNDQPPIRSPRQPKKTKGPKESQVTSRKPYRRYFTIDKTEIRVRIPPFALSIPTLYKH